jgi:CheY-like chemotaxis protein/anti-sigma regulatory factor (Ser/Thr protein kinase)
MTKPTVDLRTYRLASVVIIDLVKHSSRDKAVIHAVQTAMSEVLDHAKKTLKLDQTHFNYTGDGYVCALVGDSSARLLDFLNVVIPALRKRFAPHNQEMRIGVDFGLIHFSKNTLTGKSESFDMPSVRAARLEQAAKPGEILCTETVRSIFGQHYSQMFSKELLQVKTKDREICAYEIIPVDSQEQIRVYLTEFFLGASTEQLRQPANRKKFLIVDDEEAVREVFSTMLAVQWPNFEVLTAANGREALNLFRPGEFAAVFTDLIMPEMDGMRLTESLAELDADVPIIVVSAVHDEETIRSFFAIGGSYALLKPFEKDWCLEITKIALTNRAVQVIRTVLHVLCDDLGSFLLSLHNAAEQFRLILKNSNRVEDRAGSLLRHQAKQAVTNFVSRIGPGCDPMALVEHLDGQLACITRLSRVVGSLRTTGLEKYLRDVISDFQTLNPDMQFGFECVGSDRSLDSIQDGGILVLVISELIDNTIFALNGQGKIDTSICFLRASNLLQLTIHDSGPGVPNDLVASVFKEGVTTKGPGRGLGLSLVRSAVRALGGTISYEYKNGAQFRLVLPAA